MNGLANALGVGVMVLIAVFMVAFPADFINLSNAGLKPDSWRRVKLGVAGTRAMGIVLLALVAGGAVVLLLRG
jgi:hypothetical protein